MSSTGILSVRRSMPSGDRLASVAAFFGATPIGVYAAVLILGGFAVAALAPAVLQTHSPFRTDLFGTLQPPSPGHFFGTDQSGRDVFSRVVQGTAQSLAIGIGATTLGMAIALTLGVAAGLGGPIVDGVIGRFLDMMFAFPNLFLALLFVTVFGATVATLIVAVGVGTAPGYARIIRGQFLAVKGAAYVEAATALGHSRWRVVRQHIVPNAMRPVIAMITLGLGQSIVWASGLAFLGLGVAPPSPEWGALLDAGRDYVVSAWWLEVMPGCAIIVFALTVTLIGQHLQDRLEGRARPA